MEIKLWLIEIISHHAHIFSTVTWTATIAFCHYIVTVICNTLRGEKSIDLECISKVDCLFVCLFLQILGLELGEHPGDCWKGVSLALPGFSFKCQSVLSGGSLHREET